MNRKFITSIMIFIMLLTTVGCTDKTDNTSSAANSITANTSSEAASQNPLTSEQKEIFNLYNEAQSGRTSFASAEIIREFKGIDNYNTTLTYFAPAGAGEYRFYKTAQKNGAFYFEEGYSVSYIKRTADKTITQTKSYYFSNILPTLAKDDETHVRMPMFSDFDYSSLIIKDITKKEDGDNIIITINIAKAENGLMIDEFGGTDKCYIKDITIVATLDEVENLVNEKINFTLVNKLDNKETACEAVTTVSKINEISSVPIPKE